MNNKLLVIVKITDQLFLNIRFFGVDTLCCEAFL